MRPITDKRKAKGPRRPNAPKILRDREGKIVRDKTGRWLI